MVENTPWDLTESLALQSLSKVHQEAVVSLPLKADFAITFIRFLVLFDTLENEISEWNAVSFSMCVFT